MSESANLTVYADDYLEEIWINEINYTDKYTTSNNIEQSQIIDNIKPGDEFRLKIYNTNDNLGFGYSLGFQEYPNYILSTNNNDLIQLWRSNNTNPDVYLKMVSCSCSIIKQYFVMSVPLSTTIEFLSIIPFVGKCSNTKIVCYETIPCKININQVFTPILKYTDWEHKFPWNITAINPLVPVKTNDGTQIELKTEYMTNEITIEKIKSANSTNIQFTTYNEQIKLQYCSFTVMYCYIDCLTCSGLGDDKAQYCDSCKPNYSLVNGNCIQSSDSKKTYKYNGNIYSQADLIIELNISNAYYWDMTISTIKDIIDNKDNDIPRFIIDLNHSLQGNTFNITIPSSMTDCEVILKNHYSLSKDEQLKLFIIDELINGITTPTYYIYDNEYNRLNISLCDNTNIIITEKIPPNTNISLDVAEELAKKGINVFDPEDPFFNDCCYPYSNDNGLDMVTKDRRNDLFQNVSLCQPNCKLISVDSKTNSFNCKCNISTTPNSLPIIPISSAFIDAIPMTNLIISKCYQHFFMNNKIVYNIGFWVILGFIVIFITCLLIFISSRVKYLTNELHKSLTKFEKQEMTNNGTARIKTCMIPIQKNNDNSNRGIKANLCKDDISADNIDDDHSSIDNNKEDNNDHENIPVENKDKNQSSLTMKQEDKSTIDNSIPYTKALKDDDRGIMIIYWSIIKHSLLLFQPFFAQTPFDIVCIKLSAIILNMTLQLTINTLFYQDDLISEKYEKDGQLLTWTSLLRSLYSFLVNLVLMKIFIPLTEYQDYLENVSNEGQNKTEYLGLVERSMKKIKKKIIFFFICGIVMMLLSIYYITIFCTVYKGSQVSLFINEVMSLSITLVITIVGAFLCTLLRKCALKYKKRDLYYTSLYLVKFI